MPARRAAEAVIALFNPEIVYSVGFAGALDPQSKVGEVIHPRRVINAGDGSSVSLNEGDGVLVSFGSVASPDQKRKLRDSFGAQAVDMNFTIEGHCDERGSTDYNLALGDQRASAVKNALTAAGVNASRIKTISYGKEKPFCSESNEACWQQNRRGHFLYSK